MGVKRASGSFSFHGEDISQDDVETRVGKGLCLVPEKRELFSTMSVEDNLILGAYRLGGGAVASGLAEVFARFPRLQERRSQLAGTLSGGERQMLAMGRALMSKPALLMLDEPSLGLAPRIVKDIFQIIMDLREAGVSILLVEQNARAALQVADYAYVMELGEITMHGKAADLAADPRVIESYLGLGGRHDNTVS
jgi:branched-chain amino acid transport system ATP-binding protein